MNSDLAAQRALDRIAVRGIEGANETERILAAVWTFAAGVNNSGFQGYFAARRGDLAFLVPNALRRIDAIQLAELATEANAEFGQEGPPADFQTRQEALEKLPPSARAAWAELDREYHKCEEDIDALMERFLARHSVR